MKNSRESFIKRFLCEKTNTKVPMGLHPLPSASAVNKENKLYSLFLHEDLYPVILQTTNSSFGKSYSLFAKKTIRKYEKGSFLAAKYIIFLFRSNKFSDIKQSFFSQTKSRIQKKDEIRLSKKNPLKFGQQKKEFFFHLIFESLAFLLVCSHQKTNVAENCFFRKKTISISIHKPLESLEKQWQYYSFGFQGYFCHFFHPEVIMRILRKKIQDISFLHLIRKFLYSDMYSLDNTFKESYSKKIRNIFWNIYVLEIDNFFVSNCTDYSTSENSNYTSSNPTFSCLQKIKDWTYSYDMKNSKDPYRKFQQGPLEVLNAKLNLQENFFFLSSYFEKVNIIIGDSKDEWAKRRQISFLAESNTYKYLRTNTNWFLFFQKEKNWICLMKRRIIQFFIRRLGYVLQGSTVTPMITSRRDCREVFFSFFLAYVLQSSKGKNFVRINTKLFFLINYFVSRIISFINPFYLIILILAKQNFCSSFGYPKSKSGWVTWNDIDIIQQFNRIQNNLFLFYSGCNNMKALSRIQYILHFSCAKTLACKHKTNIRQISKKFGNTSRMKDSFFVLNQSKNSRLRSLYRNKKSIRFWNFHLTQMDSISLELEDFYRMMKI